MSPSYFRNSDYKPHCKHNQREGDKCPGNALGKHLRGPSPVSRRAAAKVEEDPTVVNSNLGGYNEMVLTKNTETINAFSSHVITTKASTAHTSERNDVMTKALCFKDGFLPQGLMVQNAYTKLRKGSKNVVVVVRNSMAYPPNLKK